LPHKACVSRRASEIDVGNWSLPALVLSANRFVAAVAPQALFAAVHFVAFFRRSKRPQMPRKVAGSIAGRFTDSNEGCRADAICAQVTFCRRTRRIRSSTSSSAALRDRGPNPETSPAQTCSCNSRRSDACSFDIEADYLEVGSLASHPNLATIDLGRHERFSAPRRTPTSRTWAPQTSAG
jgi:hypothetical protein